MQHTITDHEFEFANSSDDALGPLCTCGQPLSLHAHDVAATVAPPPAEDMPEPATVLGVVPAPDPAGEFVIPGTPARVVSPGGLHDPDLLAAARLSPVLGDARRLDRVERVLAGMYRDGTNMDADAQAEFHQDALDVCADVDRRAAAEARMRAATERAGGGVARG